MKLLEGYAAVDDLDAFLDRLDEIGEAHGCAVQAVDARYVAGRAHVEAAVGFADRAIERDDAIARDRGVEILLYLAGRRQIDDALELGITEGQTPTVVVIDGDDEAGAAEAVTALSTFEPADLRQGEELGDPDRLCEFFEIDEAELAATDADLETLVCERTALLTVEK